MIDFSKFDWGTSNEWYRNAIMNEFSENNIYCRSFDVDEGDLIIDFGSSNGPFPYSIKHKNPSHIYCLEPSEEELGALKNNLQGLNYTIIPKGISKIDGFDEITANQFSEYIHEFIKVFEKIPKKYQKNIIDYFLLLFIFK